jgi:hypothetical protein
VEGLLDLVNEMKNQHVHFKTMTDSIDTKTPVGRFFFHVMASLAMEQELIVERTRAVAGSRDWTLRVVGLAERKGNFHPSPARVVSPVVHSLRDGRTNIAGGESGRVHFLRLVEVDTKTQPPIGNTIQRSSPSPL